MIKQHLQVIDDVLKRNGHTAVNTDKPWEAARLFSDGGIDVIVADVFIHSLTSSVQIVLALRQMSSEIPVLLISGTPLEGPSPTGTSPVLKHSCRDGSNFC